MFDLGIPELVLILIIILVLFGGKKIPEFARGIGEAIKEFKEGINMDGNSKKKASTKTKSTKA